MHDGVITLDLCPTCAEPEVDYVLQSKRKLVDEDDFFMQDTAS